MNAESLRYKRILIKLSGAALKGGNNSNNFDIEKLEHIANEVFAVKKRDVAIILVIGGGNIFRGNRAKYWQMNRFDADNIGMISTIINSLMLKSVLESKNISTVKAMSAIQINGITEPFIRSKAISYLNKGNIVIVGAGIGQPFVTTDYAAVQRALELECDAVLIAKHEVDGVFDVNPNTKIDAKQYCTLAYNDFLINKLEIIDHTAILLARDYNLPIHIFNFDCKSALEKICLGQNIGTYISSKTKMEFISE